MAQIRETKGHSTTLQKLSQEKNSHNFEAKKHLTLPYKNYAKKKKLYKCKPKKSCNTSLQKLCQEKKMHKFESKST